ncbi:hypothetical protein OVA07_00220 [Novosphingobium sp. SL115]|uniref:hypothetical protein n=1 Tax=Novosphingobium sp. SL115 TaxID=2995150 RepID=UPI00227578FD|nr:hypothetical protein [Novosphingobium sp. SL115]MCY1669450.1 hypothetical protein [Novosphingobium sp. SL115]
MASEANHSMLAALNNFRFKLFNKVMLSKVLNKVFKKQKAQHWHMSHEEIIGSPHRCRSDRRPASTGDEASFCRQRVLRCTSPSCPNRMQSSWDAGATFLTTKSTAPVGLEGIETAPALPTRMW